MTQDDRTPITITITAPAEHLDAVRLHLYEALAFAATEIKEAARRTFHEHSRNRLAALDQITVEER